MAASLYYTRVTLGTPPKEYSVQIDTGSNILWVSCYPCSQCPTSSGLDIKLGLFDPEGSSTASKIACGDRLCMSATLTGEAACPGNDPSSSPCGYTFQYGDGSTTSGFYVSDTMYFTTVSGNRRIGNSSANIAFGCSNSQSGGLTKPAAAVDGLLGLGQQQLSLVSQLYSQGVAPNVFSHCLQGSADGGGTLVLGEIREPGMVYTPMVPSQPHYNLNLENISVNGRPLPLDANLFKTTSTGGTIIDSGTTLAYLVDGAYAPLVRAIVSSSSASALDVKGNTCFFTSSSIDALFPSVTLHFAGGASMDLKPENYLVEVGTKGSEILWCIGWQSNTGQSILGDIVLKDKIFVYDIANQRIGWMNYDCSSSVSIASPTGGVNVDTSPTGGGYIDTQPVLVSNAVRTTRSALLLLTAVLAIHAHRFLACLLHAHM